MLNQKAFTHTFKAGNEKTDMTNFINENQCFSSKLNTFFPTENNQSLKTFQTIEIN